MAYERKMLISDLESYFTKELSHLQMVDITDPLRNGLFLLVQYDKIPGAFGDTSFGIAFSSTPTTDAQARFGRSNFTYVVWQDAETKSIKAVGIESWGEIDKRTIDRGRYRDASIMSMSVSTKWDYTTGIEGAVKVSIDKACEMVCYAPTRIVADSIDNAQALVAQNWLKQNTQYPHLAELAQKVIDGELAASKTVKPELTWLEKYGEMMKSVPPYRF